MILHFQSDPLTLLTSAFLVAAGATIGVSLALTIMTQIGHALDYLIRWVRGGL